MHIDKKSIKMRENLPEEQTSNEGVLLVIRFIIWYSLWSMFDGSCNCCLPSPGTSVISLPSPVSPLLLLLLERDDSCWGCDVWLWEEEDGGIGEMLPDLWKRNPCFVLFEGGCCWIAVVVVVWSMVIRRRWSRVRYLLLLTLAMISLTVTNTSKPTIFDTRLQFGQRMSSFI